MPNLVVAGRKLAISSFISPIGKGMSADLTTGAAGSGWMVGHDAAVDYRSRTGSGRTAAAAQRPMAFCAGSPPPAVAPSAAIAVCRDQSWPRPRNVSTASIISPRGHVSRSRIAAPLYRGTVNSPRVMASPAVCRTVRAAGLTEDRHVAGISTELLDVVAHPFKRGDHVQRAALPVRRNPRRRSRTGPGSQEYSAAG